MITTKVKWQYMAYLLALVLLLYGAFEAIQYIVSLPKKVTHYQDIELGDSKDNIQNTLGVPTYVIFPPEKKGAHLENNPNIFVVEIFRIASKKEVEATPRKEKDFNHWEYQKYGYSVFVEFDSGTDKSELISCYVFDFSKIDKNNSCSINKIHVGDPEDKIVKVLGKPDYSENDGPTIMLSYTKLNMMIFLDDGGVFKIQIKKLPSSKTKRAD